MAARILVIGGSGYFGRLLVQDLLSFTSASILIGGRNQKHLNEFCDTNRARLYPIEVDLLRKETIAAALSGVQIAICAAGPFTGLPATLLELCLERRIHYIDLSDDRDFVLRARKVAADSPRADQIAVCSGWSAVPALSGILASMAVQKLSSVESLRIQIAPGNRFPRSKGTVASLLASVARSFTVWNDGRWRTVSGWSEPRIFEFPPPIGARRGLLVDVPDHEIFPALFSAQQVEFRVGAEIDLFNRMLSILAWPYRRGQSSAPLLRFSGVLQFLMGLTWFIGHDWGAVGVVATGKTKDGLRSSYRACVMADHKGHCIPVMPAAIMTAMLLSAPQHGLIPVERWLTREALERECDRRGFRVTLDELSAKE
jgi:hypothetical protein